MTPPTRKYFPNLEVQLIQRPKNIARQITLAAFLLSGALCACTVLLLAAHSRPTQDDFCRATLLPEATWSNVPAGLSKPGVAEMTLLNYLNWSGRWAGLGLEISLLSTVSLPGAYPYLVSGVIISQILLVYIGILLMAGGRIALYGTASVGVVYWSTMPDPQQGLFWLPGSIESQLPLSIVVLFFALALFGYTHPRKDSAVPTLAASALAFVIPAFHELMGAVLVAALSVILGRAILSKSSFTRRWLLFWICAALGFLVVLLAPGNSIRGAEVPNRGSTAIMLRAELSLSHHYILPWLFKLKHWLLAIIVFFSPQAGTLRRKLFGWSSLRAIAICVASWVSVLLFAVTAAIWNIGKQPPGRTMNLLYGIFLMGWLVIAFLVVRPNARSEVHAPWRAAVFCGALLLLAAIALIGNNTRTAVADLARGRADAWDRELDQRFELLKTADKGTDLVVPSLSAKPKSLAWYDITSQPTFWSNRCVARYFGVKSVRIPRASNSLPEF